MKRKRSDLLSDVKETIQAMNRSEQLLLLHSFVSILVGVLVWSAYFFSYYRFDPPIIPVIITGGLILFYVSHQQYVKRQNRNAENFLKELVKLMDASTNITSEKARDFKRLTDDDGIADEFYNDEHYYQNSNR